MTKKATPTASRETFHRILLHWMRFLGWGATAAGDAGAWRDARRHRLPQCDGHLPGGGESIVWVFGQGFEYHLLHRLGDGRIEAARWRKWVEDVLHHDTHRSIGHERHPPGQHLEQHHPQGVHVAAGVHRLAPALFGGHVGRRSNAHPGGCQAGVSADHLGDPEIGQERQAPVFHQHVGGLDVAVDNASLMGVIEGVGHLLDDFWDGLQVHWLEHALLEGAGLHVLHHDIG
jgi:hypothetical protein